MNERSAKVFVVDDDVTVCVALSRLIRTAGFHVETFGTAAECLSADRLKDADCLVLDVHLPDLSGLELQASLTALGLELPIVFITGRGDIPMSVRAMKAGALEFLTKPFDNRQLLDAIEQGIARCRSARQHDRAVARAAAALSVADAARASGLRAGRSRPPEQADRRRTWHGRENGQDPSRPSHAEDGGAHRCPISSGWQRSSRSTLP